MLAAMRDAGARDLVFLIGGPDGLDPGPTVKSSRSLAFGPQTWPHLIVRDALGADLPCTDDSGGASLSSRVNAPATPARAH
jgi:hypothetical protein